MVLHGLITGLQSINKIIISDHHRSLTGTGFVAEIRQIMNELDSLNIGNRRLVVLRMANSISYITTLFALLLRQSVVFVESPYNQVQMVCNTIDNVLPLAVLTDHASALAIDKRLNGKMGCTVQHLKKVPIAMNLLQDHDHPIEDVDPRMHTADLALFSSGSTGAPKAIVHQIENLILNATLHAEAVGLRETDTVGVLLPLYYSYGLVANLLSSLIVKARIDLNYQVGIMDTAWLQHKHISFLGLTPYLARTLPADLPFLRGLTIGGDILHAAQGLSLMQRFPHCDLFATYGLTEAGPRVATWKFNQDILDTCSTAPLGRPLRHVKLALRDHDGIKTQAGELIVNTPTRMLGYFYGASKGFSIPPWKQDEVQTGDLYRQHAGEMFFVGRKKHMIVQGGEKIFPVVIESAIQNIDGVIDVKVGSVPDQEKGQIAKAYIVADKTLHMSTVKRELQQRFARSLLPAQFEFVDTISRSLTGKAT